MRRITPIFVTIILAAAVASSRVEGGQLPDQKLKIERLDDHIMRFNLGEMPIQLAQRLYPDGPNCADAKIDVWFVAGRITYTSMPEGAVRTIVDPGGLGTTMMTGNGNCSIRTRIERAEPVATVTNAQDEEADVGKVVTLDKVPNVPIRRTQTLYHNNTACTPDKLDVWFEHGVFSYINFGNKGAAKSYVNSDGMDMTVGDDGCKISVSVARGN